jgi:hypothetical protein
MSALSLRVVGLGLVVGFRLDRSIRFEGVGAVEGFPVAGVEFHRGVFGAEADLVLFLVDLFPRGGRLHDFEAKLDAGLAGLLLDDGEAFGHAFVAGGDGEAEALAGGVAKDAVRSAFGEAGLGEAGGGLHGVERPGLGVGKGDGDVAVGRRLHALGVAAKDRLADEVPVGGVLEALAHVAVVEKGHHGIDAHAPARAGDLVVEGGAHDAAVGHVGLGLFRELVVPDVRDDAGRVP